MSANRLAGGVIAIGSGTAIGQLLLAAASPAISRIYSPHEFGIFTVVASVVAVLGAVSSLRWDSAIPIPTSERDAHSVVAIGIATAGFTTLVGFVAILVIGALAGDGGPGWSLWLWLLAAPVVAGLQGVQRILNQLAVRHQRYRSIATRSVLRSGATALGQISLGLIGTGAGGLIGGLALGHAAGTVGLLRGSGLTSTHAREGRQRVRLRASLREYRRFPLYLAPAGLFNSAGLQVPVLLISAIHGTTVAGRLGLTLSVLALPAAVLGQAVGQVYLGELAMRTRSTDAAAHRLFRRTSARLAIVGLVFAIGVCAASPIAFPIVFGENWTESGRYAQALGISLGAQLIAVPLAQTLIVKGRQELQLAWDVARFVLTCGSVLLCYAFSTSALLAIWAYGAASATSYVALWRMANSVSRVAVDSDSSEGVVPHEDRSR